MSPTQRQFKFGIFCAIVALLSTLYPIRNATDQFNTLELKADTNEGAVGSSTASQQSTITAGALHTCALLSAGAVKCWGHNGSGQLGDGTTSGKISPTQVSGLTSGVAAIAAGYSHTCALLTSGSVKCWGGNNRGQLGDLTYDSRTAPVAVSGLSDVSAIAAGDSFTCALLATGTVKCWGFGNIGQLGNGGSAEQRSPIDVLASGTAASNPVPLTDVTAIAAGQVHACALLSTGTVKCWGDRRYGQVGDGTSGPLSPRSPIDVLASGTAASNPVPLTDVTAISAGARSTCALLSSGAVMCWGANASGQLGDGTTTTRLNPIQVSGLTSGVTAISTSDHDFGGEAHTCALLSTGAVKCWGANQNAYQNGDGTNVSKSTPTQVSGLSSGVTAVTTGAMHSCALQSSGTVTCWGYNANNQLGTAGENANTPTAVAGLSGVGLDTAAPTFVSAATSSDGTTITLTYSEALSATTASASAFAVVVGGSSRGVSGAVVSGSTVVLTLASAVGSGQSVTVAYSDPTAGNDANAVQDSAGNDAATLSATSVTNNSTADLSVPTFVSAATSSDGTTITLTYSEALSATTASASAFEVVVGGSSRSVSSAVVSGSTVVLTLASAVGSGQSVTVAYSDPTAGNDANAVQDSAGNDVATLSATSVTNNSTADLSVPTFVSAATSSDGTTITLTYSEALSATTAAAGAFSVVVNGSAVTPSSATVSGSTVVLALTPAIQRVDTVTFSYTDPTAGNDANAVQDSAGNDAATLSATSVTNNSTADLSVPTFVSAATSADGTTITLTYSEALSATTASASAFAVVVGGSSRSVSSAVVSGSTVVLTLASAVGSGQSVTVAYSDPSGSNDSSAVQDSAGNDAATLSATSVTNNVPQPSSGGTAPTNGTTTSTSSTTTTTTIVRGPIAGTTTTTAPRRPRSTTTTVANRTTTTIRATTTTTSNVVSSPTTLSARVSSTSTASSSSTSTTTTTTTTTTTSTIAPALITSVASSAIESLQQAEEKLKTVEAQTNAVTNDLRAAQIQVGESRVTVLDPKSALVVAVNVAEGKVASLSAANASTAEIAAAVTQLENLKIAIAQNVAISIEKIAQAQTKLAKVLANPSATAVEVAEAKAALVAARIPDVSVVVSVLESAQLNTHLTPIVIPGVVDNPGSGEVVLFNGPTESQVEIVRINGSAIQLKSTDGFTLKISTRDSNGQPIQFNSRGGIVVKHGNFISISGEGFAPGTVAKTWLFSSPRELGNLNVNPDGSFAAEFPITDDIHVGDHIAQVNGLSPDGQVRSLSLDVEILPNQGPAPYDPIANRLAIAALFAQAMALLALSRGKDNDDDERGQADVSEVAIDRVDGLNMGKPDVYSPPVIGLLDQFLRNIPSQIATTQQLVARVVQDGIYLRALTGIGGVAVALSGVIVGFFAANSAGFEAMSPSFGWLLALVIVGSIDALAGGMAALTIIATTAIFGGIDSTDAIRGLLGLAVLSFAIPLVASTTRPFRRASMNSGDWLWTRMSDVVLLSLFGAWAAGAMYDALPGLYGFTSSAAGRTTTVQVVALATLIMRFILEVVATKVTGNRLTYLAEPSRSEPSASRTAFAILVRTAIMVFVAEAFIGNNIALWVGAAMYAIPKLTALVAHRFPKSSTLKVWLPAGLLRTVVMLFVARWWASNISSFSEDPETQLQAAFVLVGIPSLVLTSLGWFAGGERKWRSTPISKVLGVVVLVIGVLTVRGVLFA